MMEVSKSDYFIERLEKLIETTKAFEYHKKLVELAYGEPSHYYFDFRRLTGDPEGIYTTANVLYDEINKIGNINSAGGRELGAIPIATAISHLSFTKNPNKPINSFYVRKKEKERGLKKKIEGCIKSPAIVVDDVITTGTSAIETINAIREAEEVVEHLLVIVFRGTEEQKRKIEEENKIKLHYIFHGQHFINKYEKEHPEALTNV